MVGARHTENADEENVGAQLARRPVAYRLTYPALRPATLSAHSSLCGLCHASVDPRAAELTIAHRAAHPASAAAACLHRVSTTAFLTATSAEPRAAATDHNGRHRFSPSSKAAQ